MSFDGIVFVVEDDVASAKSLQAVLQANDFVVQTFGSAEDFLQAYDGKQRGCLVLDLRLPGMSGLDLQRELASQNIELPVVMISGHADNQSLEQALDNGASAFLQKPFPGTDLCAAILAATKQID